MWIVLCEFFFFSFISSSDVPYSTTCWSIRSMGQNANQTFYYNDTRVMHILDEHWTYTHTHKLPQTPTLCFRGPLLLNYFDVFTCSHLNLSGCQIPSLYTLCIYLYFLPRNMEHIHIFSTLLFLFSFLCLFVVVVVVSFVKRIMDPYRMEKVLIVRKLSSFKQ